MFQEPDEPIPVHAIEEGADVRIDDPTDLAPFDSDRERIERVVRPTSRSEPVAEPEKLRLVDRNQKRCPL